MNKTRNILTLGSRRLGKENWKFYDRHGNLAFINNEHKKNWYLKKNLVEVIGEFEVKFLKDIRFKPKVDDFLITPIERRCVVCGCENSLQKHHVVPSLYRRYMPEEYKSNNHHDVVLICSKDHEYYERHYSSQFRDMLAAMFKVPTISELIDSKTQIIKKHKIILNKARSIIQFSDKMDIERLLNLSKAIIERSPLLKNRKVELLTEKELYPIVRAHRKALRSIKRDLDEFVGLYHAKPIIEKVIEENLFDEFIVDWRLDFVENMKPKYLPTGWDVMKKLPYDSN